jgi:hypothetical protein
MRKSSVSAEQLPEGKQKKLTSQVPPAVDISNYILNFNFAQGN